MAIDISKLNSKTENEGTTEAGRLTALDWNTLVDAVAENQRAVAGTIKGITYNGTDYTKVVNGMLEMNVVDTTGRDTRFEFVTRPASTIAKGSECVVEFKIIDQVPSDEDASDFVPFQSPGTINFYVDGRRVGRVNNVFPYGYNGKQETIKFDFAKATNLSTKEDGNLLKIEYTNSGKVIESPLTVNVMDLSITAKVKNVYTSENKPEFEVTVRGAECNLYVKIDNTPLVAGSLGEALPINTTPLQSNIPYLVTTEEISVVSSALEHGVHTLEIWAKPANEDYSNVSTKRQLQLLYLLSLMVLNLKNMISYLLAITHILLVLIVQIKLLFQ